MLSEIVAGTARYSSWIFELVGTYNHVLLLLDRRSRPEIQKIPLVEKIHDLGAVGE